MKKTLFLILIAAFITAVLTSCSSSGQMNFTAETHKRDDLIGRNFNMLTLETARGIYHIETADQKEAEKIAGEAEEILEEADSLSKEDAWEKPEIYFLDTKPQNVPADMNIFFVEMEQFPKESNELLQEIIYRQYGCDYWVSYGLSNLNREIDTEELKAYYQTAENLSLLNLSGVRFFSLFAEEEACEMAKKTAVSLIQFAKEKFPEEVEQLLHPSDDYAKSVQELKNNWLTEMGISGRSEFEFEEISPKIRFYKNDDGEVLVQLQNIMLCLERDVFDGYYVSNVKEFERFLCLAYQDIRDMKDYMKAELSEELLQEIDLEKNIRCCKQASQVSKGGEGVINIALWIHLQHELVHTYFWEYTDTERAWLDEGLAEYLGSMKYNTFLKEALSVRYQEYLAEGNELDEADYIYMELQKESGEDFNMKQYYKSLAAASQFLEEYRKQNIENGETLKSICGLKEDNIFADWTYFECADFTSYLIEKYSLDTLVRFYLDYNSEESVLKRELSDLVEEWRNMLIRTANNSQSFYYF